jgi:hypothetical protein
MSELIESAHVLNEPGLFAVRSSGASVYYVDTRDEANPRYLRARGRGNTIASHMDDAWHPLVRLGLATDLGGVTVVLDEWWTLLVGAQHYYETRRPGHPNGDVYWVISREAWEIERLDAMPPPDDLTIDEREAVP